MLQKLDKMGDTIRILNINMLSGVFKGRTPDSVMGHQNEQCFQVEPNLCDTRLQGIAIQHNVLREDNVFQII